MVVKRASITESEIRVIIGKHNQTAVSIVYLGYLINPALNNACFQECLKISVDDQ